MTKTFDFEMKMNRNDFKRTLKKIIYYYDLKYD